MLLLVFSSILSTLLGSPIDTTNINLIEGDILTLDSQAITTRDAALDSDPLWPAAVIPYVFSAQFNLPELLTILEAMEQIERNSCLRFELHAGDINDDHIYISKSGRGCFSHIGRAGIGAQQVSLDDRCLIGPGVIIHELLHVCGFFHEHTRPDRDEHITILWENVRPEFRKSFWVLPPDVIQDLTVPYDYGSIMHYSNVSFSKDRHNKATILPKVEGVEIGQRIRLSESDVFKLNQMYRCDAFSLEFDR